MLNPWLFAAGAALVSAPIIIHLLNKRRFRIVDWAAMDFLIEADQRNRRRIQLEELLLLALRCLAVLLTGLLVARPYLPSSLTRNWFSTTRTERIVLLDDSPSMNASETGGSAMQRAKDQLKEFVTSFSEGGSGDSLTLVLTSRPARPVFSDVVLDPQTAAELHAEIDALTASDLTSRLDAACLEVRGLVGDRSDKINRVIYVLSDLRRRDWISDDSSAEGGPDAVMAAVRELAEETAGCFVVDLAESAPGNLSIVDISPSDNALLAGVTTRFNVTVRNYGKAASRDVPVRFLAGGSLPLTATMESIPPGATGSVPFSYTFAPNDDSSVAPEPVEITAELGQPEADALAADNAAFYAARVRAGISTLVVDGDPSSELGQSETFFLQRALSPPGDVGSGVLTQVVSDAEFETRALDDWQVIYLCNVYRLSEQRLKSLEEWVNAGGGLVVWPGGQIDEQYYQDHLYRGGQGLMPRPLDRIAGDQTEKTWATFTSDQPDHPAVKVFAGDASPLLESAKVFQWWQGTPPENAAQPQSSVVLSLNDPDRSPILIDRPFGRGRVMQMNVPADVEWSNWPEDASYLIVLQELNRYLARTAEDRGRFVAGQPLEEPVDLTKYETNVMILRPDGESVSRQATSNKEINSASKRSGDWSVAYDGTDQKGFYRIAKANRDGGTDAVLCAVNIDPHEGDLGRVDADLLRRGWEGSDVKLVSGEALASLTAEGGRGELWMAVLISLIAVLFIEQSLAWTFGRRR